MERSRSPTRPPLGNEPRPLVGFPVWTRPMGSATPTPPPRQYPSNFPWSQQVPGAPSTHQVALSQQSMIPLGQPGLSQQSVDLSQPHATPGPAWQPPRASMTPPRPVAQGCGMAGMMHQFPPPPPSWGQQNQHVSTVRIHLHHRELLHNLVWELHLQGHRLLEAELFQEESHPSSLANTGNQMRSSMTTKKLMDYLYPGLFEAPAGAN